MNTYGVVTSGYVDTSKSLRGAKCHATRNGFKEVYIRFNGSCNIALRATKNEKGVWVNELN